ncbi:uncharacterized protein K452DRAFT_162112 [Aplosporella prunicola CBS 121167]|uniref:Uncharacterized protein n=1 Tax=Aplosporella prunicola CBS 121167 TaxID=1176127 RepID=A0A6A6BK53_9PEZI|nr:uncharacterized protein K452DRAFT_162112 [Aplosporella prunicola CBS 121167]KAF2143773.1 hypothetical protein K452DRAFT_162112 [Aplosporella prunicola CBS 121167]
MAPPPHTVLHPTTLPSFLHHLLTPTPTTNTTLIICAPRATFEQQLLHSLQSQSTLLQPTLQTLTTTSALRTHHCTSLPALRAFLSSLTHTHKHPTTNPTTIALLNPLALHAPTPSHSAQGLSRTLAIAVDAAHATGSRLVMAECPFTPYNDDEGASEEQQEDPWATLLPLLNSSSPSTASTTAMRRGFGGWVGRSVEARSVVEQWFVFESGEEKEGEGE